MNIKVSQFSDMIKSKINKSLLTLIRGQYGFISLVLQEIKCIVFVWRCPPVQIFFFVKQPFCMGLVINIILSLKKILFQDYFGKQETLNELKFYLPYL